MKESALRVCAFGIAESVKNSLIVERKENPKEGYVWRSVSEREKREKSLMRDGGRLVEGSYSSRNSPSTVDL
jgi:hypothetical protein